MQRRTIKNKQLVSQEVALGISLFLKRGMRSEISGVELGLDYSHSFCSHILAKGPYPKFRLYPKNIVIKTFEEHHLWETQSHKLRNLPEWEWVFKLQELLKREYYTRKDIFLPTTV